MPRLREKTITATYAGRKLFDPTASNQTLEESYYEFARRYTTAEEAILDADAPIIRSHGNASGSFPLSVCYDFPTQADAYEYMLDVLHFCDANQTGVFSFTAGHATETYNAGLSSVNARVSREPATFRVTVSYSFLLTNAS